MSHNRTRCWGRPNRSPLIGQRQLGAGLISSSGLAGL
uniref:Uncharacterized protein n=1 Tax=Arundo donax TaxID=35708 RepID=A0A0A9GRA5_ARUDO